MEPAADNDEKKIDGDEESEYEYEAIVHDQDLRQPIYDLNEKDLDIIQCIGQLRVVFLYNDKGPFVKKESGTGTVISVFGQDSYILTCAHVVRTFVIECPKCNKYMNIKDNHANPISQCIYHDCNEFVSKDTDLKLIQASTIEFKRRSTQYGNDFGKMIKSYQCKEKVLHENYNRFPKTSEGYDLAILHFNDDDNFYRKYCANIIVKEFTTFNKFYIFGYGKPQLDKLYGMASVGTDWQIKQNKKTQHYYLKQRVIDTLPGVSGAAMWCLQKDKTVIFGVHTGGKASSRFNVGLLIKGNEYHDCGFSWRTKKMVGLRIRHIRKALKRLLSDLPSGIVVWSDNEFKWSASLLGPKGTPYEGGVFVLELDFANEYPFTGPKLKFQTKIYHPAVCENDGNFKGCFSLDILENWSMEVSLDMSRVFVAIVEMLKTPHKSALAIVGSKRIKHGNLASAGVCVSNMDEFNRIAKQWTLRHAQ